MLHHFSHARVDCAAASSTIAEIEPVGQLSLYELRGEIEKVSLPASFVCDYHFGHLGTRDLEVGGQCNSCMVRDLYAHVLLM
jgi:hypothetical protein